MPILAVKSAGGGDRPTSSLQVAWLVLRKILSLSRLIRIAIAILATLGSLGFMYYLGLRGLYNVNYAVSIIGRLMQGFWTTLSYVALVIPLGFTLGFFIGWARTTNIWVARAIGTTYVEFFRGMPPLVLIFFSYLVVTLISIRYLPALTPFALWAGALALAFHSGSYQAEIIRAGILSVPTGQHEAAESIGLSRWQTMFRVTLPQAFRVSLPALGNEFASVIKDTSLLAAIGVFELEEHGLDLTATAVRTDLNLVFIIWVEIALLYFAITFIVTRIVRSIENWSKVPGLEAAQL